MTSFSCEEKRVYVGHPSNHEYHCCKLTRQSSCDPNSYRIVACLAQEYIGLNRNVFYSNKCTGSVMYFYSKKHSILKDWLYTLIC